METMDFSKALELIKQGYRMRNSHWPSEMFVVYQKGYPEGIPVNSNTAKAVGIPVGTTCYFRPYLLLHTVMPDEYVPYVATQSDLLSEVWVHYGEDRP